MDCWSLNAGSYCCYTPTLRSRHGAFTGMIIIHVYTVATGPGTLTQLWLYNHLQMCVV